MLQEHYLDVHCSRSIFRYALGALCILKYAPGAYLLYAPGALCIQICSWSMFDLQYYSRLLMLLEQLFLEQLLLEHNLGPKSHKSQLGRGHWHFSKGGIRGKIFSIRIAKIYIFFLFLGFWCKDMKKVKRIIVFDTSSHQIYYQDCKYRLLSLFVLTCFDFLSFLATIWLQKSVGWLLENIHYMWYWQKQTRHPCRGVFRCISGFCQSASGLDLIWITEICSDSYVPIWIHHVAEIRKNKTKKEKTSSMQGCDQMCIWILSICIWIRFNLDYWYLQWFLCADLNPGCRDLQFLDVQTSQSPIMVQIKTVILITLGRICYPSSTTYTH